MLSQLKEEVCNVGGEGLWAIPVKDSNRRASVNNRVPKMNFRGREVENGRDAKGDETKGLKMRE